MSNLEFKWSPLTLEDGDKLKEWTSFESPLFVGYNYNNLTEREKQFWYISKQRRFNSSYFSIYVGDEMIGYIGIKEINKLLKTAKLGIVFDSKWTSKGYGSAVLKDFLDYYFNDLRMRRLDLEVNSWNDRAIKLYKKFGFKINSSKYIEFENQRLDLSKPEYIKYKDDFIEKDGKLFTKIYLMNLKRQEYFDEI
ncbi:GNAT family N-acetyltransferase [Helcococcus kunzii]|uniref:GNAT family N-acetyltransferase n=1 Tax=Helcococcus kunzii TaxID=40091 RepID=UPI001BAF72F6|nr:GNAT family N-acetyltransferase [Helcococcus kunzii]MCT1796266.1 GNAT family N-acetyltransferase [Helcococcus kunzii]MCT1989124.1 GNAT family N-acetyltransferase [Helcococcus kunzii]QUY64206.1 GNAT family N-acetyltransferase [Helcococcus kunzii]QZO76662.1 GNAT family N-acetyltransferase [Helcococcus kunzii]